MLTLVSFEMIFEEFDFVLQLHDFDMHLNEGAHGHSIEGVGGLLTQTTFLFQALLP